MCLNSASLGFIVEDMLSLLTIESPRFRKILDKVPGLASQHPTGRHFPISLPEQVLYRHGIKAQNNFRILPGSCVHHRRHLVRQQPKVTW